MLKFYDPCKYNDFFRILFKVTHVKVPTGLNRMTSTSVPKKRISLIVPYELAVTPLPPKIICSIKILYSQFIL